MSFAVTYAKSHIGSIWRHIDSPPMTHAWVEGTEERATSAHALIVPGLGKRW